MVIKLSSTTEKEIFSTIKDYGYESEKEFVEDALKHWILALKKADFLKKVKKIRAAMRKKGLTEREILKDFEEFFSKK